MKMGKGGARTKQTARMQNHPATLDDVKAMFKGATSDDGTDINTELNDGTDINTELNDGTDTKTELNDGTGSKSELNDGTDTKTELNDGTDSKTELSDDTDSKTELNDGTDTKTELNDGTDTKTELDDGTVKKKRSLFDLPGFRGFMPGPRGLMRKREFQSERPKQSKRAKRDVAVQPGSSGDKRAKFQTLAQEGMDLLQQTELLDGMAKLKKSVKVLETFRSYEKYQCPDYRMLIDVYTNMVHTMDHIARSVTVEIA